MARGYVWLSQRVVGVTLVKLYAAARICGTLRVLCLCTQARERSDRNTRLQGQAVAYRTARAEGRADACTPMLRDCPDGCSCVGRRWCHALGSCSTWPLVTCVCERVAQQQQMAVPAGRWPGSPALGAVGCAVAAGGCAFVEMDRSAGGNGCAGLFELFNRTLSVCCCLCRTRVLHHA